MREKIISVNSVSYTYGGENAVYAVRNVTFDICKGEFVAILGHNGSGKSTLSKLLNGFFEPSEGNVTIEGMLTTDESHMFDIRKKVGIVFQNPDNQMVASIIEDDIAFGCENLGIPREEIAKRVEWALDVVNMSEYRSMTPFKLSGGQKQRIAIAAILAMLPEVLILDESTSMLDPKGRKEVLETVKLLNSKHNMTVILITHYMDEALDADKVIVLNAGEVVGIGTPGEIFADKEMINSAKLELPIATNIAYQMRRAGLDIPQCLTDKELVEGICRLR